jgi:hypothetical protein
MKDTFMRILILAGVLAVAGTAVSQGFYTENKTSGGPLGGSEFVGKSFYMPKMIKVITGAMGSEMIFRMDKQMIYEVNRDEKTYSETTFEEWEASMKKLQTKMDGQMSELQKKLDAMPEEQRKMVEKMMGNRAAGKKDAKTEVVAGNEKKTLAGLTAAKYVVTEDGKETMTVWATNDLKGFDAMRKDYEDYTKKLMAGNPSGMSGLVEAMKKIKGFPMEINFGNDMKMEVTKAESRSLAQSEFEVPAGFTTVKSKIMEQMNTQP